MNERSDLEARPVLAPRQARRTRLALLVPVIALVAITWAGLTGARPANDATAEVAGTPSALAASPSVEAPEEPYPTEALGLAVHRLDEVQLARLTADNVVAISGWYVPLAVTNCPAGVPSKDGPLPEVRPGFDPWAFCERSGVLYAAQPGPGGRVVPPSAGAEVETGNGPQAVSASMIPGVRLPSELEVAQAHPTRVVVLGHFVETSSACMLLGACPSELVVDYFAWAPTAPTG